MRVLIAGGSGFLGSALRRLLLTKGHSVTVLTRAVGNGRDSIHWDGKRAGSWTRIVSEMDSVVNACGFGLEHWPWLNSRKRHFAESRTIPGRALADAIAAASPRPRMLIQFSGINRYGLDGDSVADETTPAADDFLAQLTISWEDSTRSVEELGVRRVIARNAVVLDRWNGIFPIMCLPARLRLGGCIGNGQNVIPWIHIADYVRALLFLLEHEEAAGAYNLVAPVPSKNADFMRAVCDALRCPYWLHVPARPIRVVLGEMANLVLKGRASSPQRLLEAGFSFDFPEIHAAAHDLLAA
jgi:uncharacterized protein (TIGR01777 family)